MSNPTGLEEDLTYLRIKYDFKSEFFDCLLASSESALLRIQLYKTNMWIVCVIPASLGLLLLGFGIVWHEQRFSLFACGTGSIVAAYYFGRFIYKRTAIIEMEKIASYHGLI